MPKGVGVRLPSSALDYIVNNENMHHHHEHNSEHWIWTAFLLNLVFAVIEFIWWTLTNSIAIISDSIHDLWDSLAIWLAYIFEKISKKKANEKYNYWYARYSILWALITVLILVVWSIFIIKNAIQRFSEPKEINSIWMLILAVIWLAINWYAARKTAKWEWLNEKAITLHLLEDVFGRAAVLIWAMLIYFFQRNFIDSVLSIWICVFILFNACVLLKWIMDIFLEKTPEWISYPKLIKQIKNLKWIQDAHHMHVWTLNWEKNYLTIHALIDKNLKTQDIIHLKKEMKELLKSEWIHHSVIEFEWEDENCEEWTFCED